MPVTKQEMKKENKVLKERLAKAKSRKRFFEMLDDRKFKLIDEVLELYFMAKARDDFRMQYNVLKEMLRYALPQVKSVELDDKQGKKMHMNITFTKSKKNKQGQLEDVEETAKITPETNVDDILDMLAGDEEDAA